MCFQAEANGDANERIAYLQIVVSSTVDPAIVYFQVIITSVVKSHTTCLQFMLFTNARIASRVFLQVYHKS